MKKVDVLIVEDDKFFREFLKTFLESKSFSVVEAVDGKAMYSALQQYSPDLVLLDLNLPGTQGLDLARELRHDSGVGIIILTGSEDDYDKIVGLEIGADDYVIKGVDSRELLARIRSLLRRLSRKADADSPAHESNEIISFGDFDLHRASRSLRRSDGQEIPLTSHEFSLLEHMLLSANRVLTRDQLMQAISGRDWYPNDRSIDAMVVKIRRKIEKDPKSPKLIKTVRGSGYMFAGQVDRVR